MKMPKILFIDRDGVINKDPGGWTKHSYVTNWKEFHFLPGSLEALKLLNRNRIRVVIISNQAGVSKGYFTKEMLAAVNSKMLDEINKQGGRIEDVYYCTHKTEDNCSCRNPKTGMLEMAAEKHNIDIRRTYFIGDSLVDITAGRLIGAKTIFVLSGKATAEDVKKWDVKPDYIFPDLLESVKWLLGKEKRKSLRAERRETEGKRPRPQPLADGEPEEEIGGSEEGAAQ